MNPTRVRPIPPRVVTQYRSLFLFVALGLGEAVDVKVSRCT
jgi:hypothetical protein